MSAILLGQIFHCGVANFQTNPERGGEWLIAKMMFAGRDEGGEQLG